MLQNGNIQWNDLSPQEQVIHLNFFKKQQMRVQLAEQEAFKAQQEEDNPLYKKD